MADVPQKLPPDVWVVVPAYNEGRRLAATLDKLLGVDSCTSHICAWYKM